MLEYKHSAIAMNPQIAVSALEELSTIYLVTNNDLYIVAASPRSLTQFFIPSTDEIVGQFLVEIIPELVGSEQDLAAIAGGKRGRFELRRVNRTLNGDLFYIDVVAFPYHGLDHDQSDGLLVLLSDVTRASRLEQQVTHRRNELQLAQTAVARRNRQLSETNHRLNQLLEERSAFFKMAVHDLKSPLYCIVGYADLLTDPTSDLLTEEQRLYIDTMRKRAEATSQIVDDLLEVERIESGQAQISPRLIDLCPLIDQAVELIEVQASQRGITVEWCGPSSSALSTFADSAAVERVLSNLLSNAVKYSDHGDSVIVQATSDDNTVRVEVTDQGMGISLEDQGKVFQRFYRTQTARESGGTGTGLGLSIVQALIQQLEGIVGCTSEPGAGSTFWFTLPRTPQGESGNQR